MANAIKVFHIFLEYFPNMFSILISALMWGNSRFVFFFFLIGWQTFTKHPNSLPRWMNHIYIKLHSREVVAEKFTQGISGENPYWEDDQAVPSLSDHCIRSIVRWLEPTFEYVQRWPQVFLVQAGNQQPPQRKWPTTILGASEPHWRYQVNISCIIILKSFCLCTGCSSGRVNCSTLDQCKLGSSMTGWRMGSTGRGGVIAKTLPKTKDTTPPESLLCWVVNMYRIHLQMPVSISNKWRGSSWRELEEDVCWANP